MVFTYFLLFPFGKIISIIVATITASTIPCAHEFKNFTNFITYLYIIPLLDILRHIASPTISKIATKNIIPRSTLKVPPIWSNKDTIFLSASGSHTAEANLYVKVNIASFTIGIAHIPIIITIPTIPIEFFKRAVEP